VSQAEASCTLGPQSPRNRTDPPTPFGRDSLTYPVFAAVDCQRGCGLACSSASRDSRHHVPATPSVGSETMKLFSWLNSIRRSLAQNRRRAACSPIGRIEKLEDRTLLSSTPTARLLADMAMPLKGQAKWPPIVCRLAATQSRCGLDGQHIVGRSFAPLQPTSSKADRFRPRGSTSPGRVDRPSI